jgi:hypothetical protein
LRPVLIAGLNPLCNYRRNDCENCNSGDVIDGELIGRIDAIRAGDDIGRKAIGEIEHLDIPAIEN